MAAFRGAGDAENIGARYRLLLSDAMLKWTMECSAIQTEMTKAGRWGSGAMVTAICSAFRLKAREAVEQALRETSNAIRSRGSAWNSALDALSELIHSEFANVEKMAIGQCQGTSIRVPDQMRAHAKGLISNTLSALVAEIEAYRVGWSSPKPEKFTERHPVLWPIMLILIGATLGLLVEPLKDRIQTLAGAEAQPARATSPT